jgi:hypothetical protein
MPKIPCNGAHVASWGGNIVFDGWPMEVAGWRMSQHYEHKDLDCSGQLGSTTSRNVGYNYKFEFDVIWDYQNAPEIDLKPLSGLQAYFYMGDQASYNAFKEDESETIAVRYYWCPNFVLDTCKPAVDANTKKMIRVACTGHSRTHCFLIPDEGILSDDTTVAGAYYYALTHGNVIL